MAEKIEIATKVITRPEDFDTALEAVYNFFFTGGCPPFKLVAASGLYFCIDTRVDKSPGSRQTPGIRECSIPNPENHKKLGSLLIPDERLFAFTAIGNVLSAVSPYPIPETQEQRMHLETRSGLYVHLDWPGVQDMAVVTTEELTNIQLDELTPELFEQMAAQQVAIPTQKLQV